MSASPQSWCWESSQHLPGGFATPGEGGCGGCQKSGGAAASTFAAGGVPVSFCVRDRCCRVLGRWWLGRWFRRRLRARCGRLGLLGCRSVGSWVRVRGRRGGRRGFLRGCVGCCVGLGVWPIRWVCVGRSRSVLRLPGWGIGGSTGGLGACLAPGGFVVWGWGWGPHLARRDVQQVGHDVPPAAPRPHAPRRQRRPGRLRVDHGAWTGRGRRLSGGRPNGPRLVAGPVRAMLAAARVAYLGSYLETVKTR